MSIRVSVLKRSTIDQVTNANMKCLVQHFKAGAELIVSECKKKMEEYHRNVTGHTMMSINKIVDNDLPKLSVTIGGCRNIELVMKGTPPEPDWHYGYYKILHWVELKHLGDYAIGADGKPLLVEVVPTKKNKDAKGPLLAYVFINSRSGSLSDRAKWSKQKRSEIHIKDMDKPTFSLGFRLPYTGTTVEDQRHAATYLSWDPALQPDIPGGNGRSGSSTWGNYGRTYLGDTLKGYKISAEAKRKLVSDAEEREHKIAGSVLKQLRAKGTLRWRGLQPDPITDGIKVGYPQLLAEIDEGLRCPK